MTKTAAELDADIALALELSKSKQKKTARRRRNAFDLTEVRHEIDAATTAAGLDRELDPMTMAQMAADAYGSCKLDEHRRILANIPPVRLGRTLFRVVGGGRHGLDLAGPRGGYSALVQNPDLWGHTSMGSSGKTTWYRRNPDWTFTPY